jgi:adenylate cyclase
MRGPVADGCADAGWSLQREWRASGFEQPWKMRVGISTSYCNVGDFGSNDRMDCKIVGAEVNLAARIEAAPIRAAS